MRGSFALLVLIAALLGGCLDTGQTDDDPPTESHEKDPVHQTWEVPMDNPVQVRVLPDGDILVASLDGRVLLLSSNGTPLATVIEIDVQPLTGEYGLLGMAVHPAYPEEPWIYVFYTLPGPGNTGGAIEQSIARFKLPEGSLEAGGLEGLVTLPASPACCHNGGRLAFDSDQMLYATLGDNLFSPHAQNPAHPAGSILRYTDNGEIPPDNPYPESPVVVTGMRNPFGLHIDERHGIVATDNGPSTVDGPPGYDQIYILQVGDNAGWPLVYGDTTFPGRTDPVWHSGSTPIAPTGVHVPIDSRIPEWDGKILFCNWNTDEAMLLDPAGSDPEPEVVFDNCRFDATQDGQGRILFAGAGEIHVLSGLPESVETQENG